MPIPVPITRTKIATVPWGIPITNEVNRLTAATAVTAWATLTLTNGWVTYGQTPQYRKIGDIVYLRGTMNGGARDTIFTTLPAGFRSPQNLNFIAYHWPNTPSACFVNVAADGTCKAQTIDGGTVLTYVSLDQIYFCTV